MDFLDNLENSLKSLESREERSGNQQQHAADRVRALGAAPWLEKLKSSTYLQRLMDEATKAGHERRAKIYMAWLGNNFRLELREHRMELQPRPDGIEAVFLRGPEVVRSERVDIDRDDPAGLIQRFAAKAEKN